jgi:hypothetical protein
VNTNRGEIVVEKNTSYLNALHSNAQSFLYFEIFFHFFVTRTFKKCENETE